MKVKVEQYSGFANGKWLSDELFQHNDGRTTERLFANAKTIYCGRDGIKRHGYYWRAGELQPRLGAYLGEAHGEAADDSSASWLGTNNTEEN